MGKKKYMRQLKEKIGNNHGVTLIEMIVCFMLLAIFMACAASLISSISLMYFNIKGEIYGREVSDILMEKVVSEVDGAEFSDDAYLPEVASDNSYIDLCDKTGTHIKVYKNNDKLVVYYYPIVYNNNPNDPNSRAETEWYFDDGLYNGFKLKELQFYRGGTAIGPGSETAALYGLNGINMNSYDKSVVLVLMKLKSDKYGEYYSYRFVKMYNYTDENNSTDPNN